ncbi:ubiquitin-like-specific protease 1 isoform X2 [Mangifera indica]|nr:ubiquitin-like-specific protease 1 isoform X2 [Mangifera indica]
MEWPTFFLDQINGISLRTKEFFRPWSSVDKVFFPINFDNQHWVCGVLDINEWRMYIYDSAQYTESIERVKKLLMPFRTLTHLMKASNFYISKGIPSPDPLPTLQYRCVRDVPKQDVGSGDCGIFLLMFMEYLARDHPFNFTSAHSKRLRKRVATTIFQGRTLSFEDF